MAVDNIFVTLADFIKQELLGGSVIGYTLFAIFIVALLFIFFLLLRIPPKFSLLLISPAIIGVFTGLVNLTWIVVVLLVLIFATMGILALRWWGGER